VFSRGLASLLTILNETVINFGFFSGYSKDDGEIVVVFIKRKLQRKSISADYLFVSSPRHFLKVSQSNCFVFSAEYSCAENTAKLKSLEIQQQQKSCCFFSSFEMLP
jgi:hypothetical protein